MNQSLPGAHTSSLVSQQRALLESWEQTLANESEVEESMVTDDYIDPTILFVVALVLDGFNSYQ